MTGEEFAKHLHEWKREFEGGVIVHFRSGDRERGNLAFERWKERFTSFLKEHAPDEANRFIRKTTHFIWVAKPDESEYKRFMREDGDTCLAFIDDLEESILKGYVELIQTRPKSKRRRKAAPKIFLSYASEDISAARRLYNDLGDKGADIWFDKESLLGGQNWKVAIGEAIRESRFFLALLSTKSVNKRGFVQKELKDALKTLEEYPQSDIFVIPVRLEVCTPSDNKLHEIQWIDMFPNWEDGLRRIMKVIRLAAEPAKSSRAKKSPLPDKRISGWIYVGNYDYVKHEWAINTDGIHTTLKGIAHVPPFDLVNRSYELDIDVNIRTRPTAYSQVKFVKSKGDKIIVGALSEIQHVVPSWRIIWAGLVGELQPATPKKA